MKKQPGINGDYLILSRDERMALATLPTLVTLGTPAAVQTVYAFSPDMGPIDWALPLVLWIYGLLFWFNSEGIHLFKAKKWEWTEEAIEEQQRYMSDTRIASRRFWKKWWVRFPIGLLFMSVGIHALFSRDFTAQWLSFILLMSAFVTPFVFIAELAMLPLAILIVLGFMAVVTLTPTSVIIMLAVLAMFATVVLAQNVRASQLQKPVRKKKEDQETKDKEGEEGKDAEGATAGSNASAAAPVGRRLQRVPQHEKRQELLPPKKEKLRWPQLKHPPKRGWRRRSLLLMKQRRSVRLPEPSYSETQPPGRKPMQRRLQPIPQTRRSNKPAVKKQKALAREPFFIRPTRTMQSIVWCLGSESNRHSLRNRILSPARLPISPPRR
ncbi:MAG: hypothetical protein RLZZ20_2023 [Pseudomonadota bacterium]